MVGSRCLMERAFLSSLALPLLLPSHSCGRLGFRASTGGIIPLLNKGGGLGGLCLVGEKPGLGALLFNRAGPAIGLEEGSFKPFTRGAGRGDFCLAGERPGDRGACCGIGLITESAVVCPGGAARGEARLVGEKPGDGGTCGSKFGPVMGLEESICFGVGAGGGDWCFTGGGSGGGRL